MIRKTIKIHLAICLLAGIAVAKSEKTADDPAAMRVWTSRSGATLEASFVESKYGKALLKREDGSSMSISLRNLSAADQAFIKKLKAKKKGTGSITKPKPNELPVFVDGPGDGLHTLYEGKEYDLTFGNCPHHGNRERNRPRIIIYPKKNGERVGTHVSCWLTCRHMVKPRSKHRFITQIECSEKPTVTREPHEIRIEGEYDDTIRFDVTMTIAESSFSIEGTAREIKRDSDYSRFGYKIVVPQTHEEPKTKAEIAALKALLKGWSVKLRTYRDKPLTYEYTDSVHGVRANEADIKGPWEDIELNLEVEDSRSENGSATNAGKFHIYSGMPPYVGYSFGPFSRVGGEPGKLTLTFK